MGRTAAPVPPERGIAMGLSVEDQLAIQQLYARYNHAIDSGDIGRWVACFTPDAVFTSPAGTYTGSAEIEGFARWYTPLMQARHWTNNLVLEGDGTSARGSCYLVLFRLTPGETPPAAIYATGIYRDDLRKLATGWAFSSRVATFDS
jgi:hypothetical protein